MVIWYGSEFQIFRRQVSLKVYIALNKQPSIPSSIHLHTMSSSANHVILPKDFNPALLTFSEPRQLESGGRSIYLSYDGQPFSVQTPEMAAPFGMSNYRDRAGGAGPDKWTLDLSFKGINDRPNMRTFFTLLETLDRLVVEYALANSQTLFKKRHTSAEVVAALYTPAIKFAKDRNTGEVNERFPPTFKMALPLKDGRFLCETYDSRRTRTELTDVETKGSSVTAITRCVAIWVINGKFGVTWKAQQLKITPSSSLHGYAFKETDEDSSVKGGNASDDDNDDIIVPRATPPALKVTKSRVVKRGLAIDDEDDVRIPPSVRSSDDDLDVTEPPPLSLASTRLAKGPFM